MNTMADGAAQRLVAQIGEALFGQPGLTLIELAEKVKGTQPSPAGQDVRAQFEAWMTDVAKIVVDSSDPYPAALEREYWRVWQAALAARQPVGEPVWAEIRRQDDRTFPRVMKWGDAEAFVRTCNVAPIPTVHPLYSAPPAQAVDLSMPISMIDQALARLSTVLDDLESIPDRRPAVMVAETIGLLHQALIGVPNG